MTQINLVVFHDTPVDIKITHYHKATKDDFEQSGRELAWLLYDNTPALVLDTLIQELDRFGYLKTLGYRRR